MRTTITLDAEAVALVKKTMSERRMTFKDVVNSAIKRGLGSGVPAQQVDLPTFDMGPAHISLDKATQLAGALEDEEILRKMSTGQ